ncbi:transcription factor c2h2 [Stemphylium lycopersici]|nr:transcription factor c2h2 [Stemphylium lycopersici]RAR03374.1 transcription factor c2h2 [Stemphylium lycopersici]
MANRDHNSYHGFHGSSRGDNDRSCWEFRSGGTAGESQIGYASRNLNNATTGSTLHLHEPIPTHSTTPASPDFARPNENFAFVQTGHPTDLQYLSHLNAWNDYTGPADNQTGDPYFDVTFTNPSMGLMGGGQNFGFEYSQTNPSTFTPELIHGYFQADLFSGPELPGMDNAQLVSPPYPAMAPPAGPLAAIPTAPDDSIRCPKGCRATFGRGEELHRHMKKHQAHRFRCPLIECDKTFYRADKLRDHAKRGHRGVNPLGIQ